jgi:UDPglucose 6-dehydrogenase
MRSPVIIDGRNLYDPHEMAARGFTYWGVGRGIPPVLPEEEKELSHASNNNVELVEG